MIDQPPGTHVAQLNVATALDDMGSPRLADFVAALARVNAVAERSPGFVWRLKDDSGDATSIDVGGGPRFIVNLSVWETPAHLERFVWRTVHKRVYARRSAWFQPHAEAGFVMWWVPVGHVPDTAEAVARLAALRANGPSDHAFGWESLPDVVLWKEERCA